MTQPKSGTVRFFSLEKAAKKTHTQIQNPPLNQAKEKKRKEKNRTTGLFQVLTNSS
jgi:hypothetical protein